MRPALFVLCALAAACGQPREPSHPDYSYDTEPGPAKPWPAEGLCIDYGAGCRVYTPAEIAEIQRAVIAYIDAPPPKEYLARARELAVWPISAPLIGGYRAKTIRDYPAHPGVVLQLIGVTHSQDDADSGFQIFITETAPGAWTVLSLDTWSKGKPHTL